MEVYLKGAPEVMGDICEKDSCTTLGCSQFVVSHRVTNSPTGLRRPPLILYPGWLSCYRRCGKEY